MNKEIKRNHLSACFDARSENESLARMMVASFMAEMNPTIDEMDDVKTAVSEAVTNAILHGYESNPLRQVELRCERQDKLLFIDVIDTGVGIENIERAKEPFYTTKADMDRSGMGFAFMEAFMDEVKVESSPGKGTRVRMTKCIGATLV